jgi:hypothetical protein
MAVRWRCRGRAVRGFAVERTWHAPGALLSWLRDAEQNAVYPYCRRASLGQPLTIGARAAWIRAICAGVVMPVSSSPKCLFCTPETMYCHR